MYRGGGKSPAVVGRVERVAVVEGRCGGRDMNMPRGFLEPSGPSLEFRHFHSSVTVALMADLFSEGSSDLESSSSTLTLHHIRTMYV